MSDLIERSAVIDLIDKYTQDMSTDYWTANYGIPSGVFEDEIMDLPSVQPELIAQDAYVRGFEQGRIQGKVDAKLQPERKTATWLIRKWGDDAKCSNCGRSFKDVYDMDNYDQYCRHCGAHMKGVTTT